MNVPDMLSLNDKAVTEEQFKDILNTCYVEFVMEELEPILKNGKVVSFEGHTAYRVVFNDWSYIHVFLKDNYVQCGNRVVRI